MGFLRCSVSDREPESPCVMFCVAPATPSTNPTTLPLAFRVCVRKIGRIGTSISVEISANKLVRASRNVFLERPLKYRYVLVGIEVARRRSLARKSEFMKSRIKIATRDSARQHIMRLATYLFKEFAHVLSRLGSL